MYISILEKISFYLGSTGLLFLPISISLTQFFLYISSLITLILYFKKKFNYSLLLKAILPFLVLYIYLLTVSLIQKNSLKFIATSEWKDVFLVLFFLWSYYFTLSDYNEKLFRIVLIIFFVFIGIGMISLFLPFRLANLLHHLQHGFTFNGTYRAQHLILPLDFISIQWVLSEVRYPLGIYMPVGFYSTHLSFGSVIAIMSFYFLSLILLKLHYKSMDKNSILLFVITGICILILFFTQARSSIFGFIIITLILFFVLLNSTTYNHQKKHIFKFLIYILLFLSLILIIVMILSPNLKEIIFQIIGLEKKHTDYQRNLLWFIGLKVFLKNPWFGYGVGNFKETIFNEILYTIREKPYLWYPLYQTEIMHGHNDLLHFLVIGGILASFFYIYFFYQQMKIVFLHVPNIVKILYEDKKFHLFNYENYLIFLFLPIFLLFAGMFQCYFLSDHTMQLFWILYGISLGLLHKTIKKEENYV